MLTEMDGVETLKNVKHHNYYKFLKIIYIIIIHIKKYFEIFVRKMKKMFYFESEIFFVRTKFANFLFQLFCWNITLRFSKLGST